VHETALADARYSDERDELRALVATRPFEGVDEQTELAVATDERCAAGVPMFELPGAPLLARPRPARSSPSP
jgi:hypothetical protein